MRLSAKSRAIILAAGLWLAASPAHAAGDAVLPSPAVPASPAAAMDPALRQALTGMATLLLADFAGRMAGGSADSFDPGPALERAMGNILAGGDLDRLIDRVVGQALAGNGGAAADLPPEIRAALALAARSIIANARREMARDFARP